MATSVGRATRIYVSAVVLAGVLALLVAARIDLTFTAQAPTPLAFILFAGLALLLELGEHRLAVSATGSIAFIIFLAAVLSFGPTWAAVISVVSLVSAHALNRRPWIKIAFNAAQHALALLVGASIYVALGGPIPPLTIDEAFLPFFAMVFGFFAVNSTAVSAAVAISEGRALREVWIRNTWNLAAYEIVASALSLGVAYLYIRFGAFGMVGVVAPVFFIRHIYNVNILLQATHREMLDVMVKSIEARDPYTSGHSQRVAELARRISRELGLGVRETDEIATAALLHDVGKIYEEFAPILRKAGPLTTDERRVMETHTLRSAELVATVTGLRGRVEQAVRYHHENFDGSGYPEGLAGEDIPLAARIIMVADTTDAMTSHRPYRAALSYREVIEELRKYAGKQFDPLVVDAFENSASVKAFVEGLSAREIDIHPVQLAG